MPSPSEPSLWSDWDVDKVSTLAGDVLSFTVFVYFWLYVYPPGASLMWVFLTFGVLMVAWRAYRLHVPWAAVQAEVPYTVGYVKQGGREMFLVATLHISPKSPKDVFSVIESQNPDVTMIELDEERLRGMRAPPPPDPERPMVPRQRDLQVVTFKTPAGTSVTAHGQRAYWNAEFAGEVIKGVVAFDEKNPLLATAAGGAAGDIALVDRSAAVGERPAFALRAENAWKQGVGAVLIINDEDKRLPLGRIGVADLQTDLQIWRQTRRCGFPPVPVVLLPHEDGLTVKKLCLEQGPVTAEIQVKGDGRVRRTLGRRCCQACALFASGIGILYGIIGLCEVDVGGEFMAADDASKERGLPCLCIDVDLDKFWARIRAVVIPWPSNVLNALWCWLSFPRVGFQFLFPPRTNVDVFGAMFPLIGAFPLRTWAAFGCAGFCASLIVGGIFNLLASGATSVGEGTGIIDEGDAADFQIWLMLTIELYLLPQIYTGVAASRDETMYQQIVIKNRERNVKRSVVVVGAGHANGILQRCRDRGLS